VSFDPNVRQLLMGPREEVLAVVHELLAVADVVKASDEDAGWLEPDLTAEEVAASWLSHGPALVVITRGGEGAVAAGSTGERLHRPGVPVDVIDTVGAGDSFMSALLAGLARRDLLGAARRQALRSLPATDLAALLDEAIAASAITCSRPGADPPHASEVFDG
jgi:fructokinase